MSSGVTAPSLHGFDLVVEDGRVVGLVVRADGRDLRVRAQGGVVLTAGGFIFNEDMVAEHCPDAGRPFPAWRVGQDNDDGRGIRLGWGARGASKRVRAEMRGSVPRYSPWRSMTRATAAGTAATERFVGYNRAYV